MASKGGAADLLRRAGQEARKNVLKSKNGTTRSSSDGIFDILQYIESDWGLAMKLFPAQRVIVKLYYGLELDSKIPSEVHKQVKIRDIDSGQVKYTLSEREYVSFLHSEGRCNIAEYDHPRRELLLAIGRRAGKTTISGIFASYEIYRLLNLGNPQAYYGLPNGNRIQVISVAVDKDQASILFNEVAGHLAKCDYFRPYQANNTQSQVNFRTPYDIEKFGNVYRENGKYTSFNGKASLRLTFRGATGKGLRGAGNIVIILDEFAHFLDSGPSSAEDIYNAVTPSSAAFSPKDPNEPTTPIGEPESRIVCISSPLGKSGKFHSLYSQAMHNAKGSENMLAIQAPTWEINPTVPLPFLQQAKAADPRNFSVEYGAYFNDQVSGWIERQEDLLACVDKELRPQIIGKARQPHFVGIDVGLVGDGTFICITHINAAGKIVLDYHEGWYAGVDWRETNPHLGNSYPTDYAKNLKSVERLDFDEISKWFEVTAKRFYVQDGLFDSWNGIPLEQSLAKKGLTQFKSEHFTQDASSKIYQALKMMMLDESLSLYDWPIPETGDILGGDRHSAPIAELFSLRAKQLSKNVVKVEAPQKPGAHDDFSDALSRSVWLAVRYMKTEKYGAIRQGYAPVVGNSISFSAFQRQKLKRTGDLSRVATGRVGGFGRFRRG